MDLGEFPPEILFFLSNTFSYVCFVGVLEHLTSASPTVAKQRQRKFILVSLFISAVRFLIVVIPCENT